MVNNTSFKQTYALVFGRSNLLSFNEFYFIMKSKEIDFNIKSLTPEFIVFETNNDVSLKELNLFGAVKLVKINLIKQRQKIFKVPDELLSLININAESKINIGLSIYGISINFSDYKIIAVYLRDKLKKLGLKVNLKFPRFKRDYSDKILQMHPGDISNFKQNKDFDVCMFFDDVYEYYGFNSEVLNPKIIKKLMNNLKYKFDIESTIPRLAGMIINLAVSFFILNYNKKPKTLLDPFCGLGSFLIQANNLKLKAIGIDSDEIKIKKTKSNLSKEIQENKIKVINKDSRTTNFKVDIITTEPYMGKLLKKKPNEKYAKNLMRELSKLYSEVFQNNKAKILVVILPYIKLKEKIFTINKDVFKEYQQIKFIDFNLKPVNFIKYESGYLDRIVVAYRIKDIS